MPGLYPNKFVLLSKSELDLPADPKKAEAEKQRMIETGEYQFKEQVFVNYHVPDLRPKHWLTWIRYWQPNGFRELYEQKTLFGYREVKRDDFLYWPLAVPPNNSGHYVCGDLILCQRSLLKHLQSEFERRARTRGGARSAILEFNEKMKAGKGQLPSDMFEELISDLPTG